MLLNVKNLYAMYVAAISKYAIVGKTQYMIVSNAIYDCELRNIYMIEEVLNQSLLLLVAIQGIRTDLSFLSFGRRRQPKSQ